MALIDMVDRINKWIKSFPNVRLNQTNSWHESSWTNKRIETIWAMMKLLKKLTKISLSKKKFTQTYKTESVQNKISVSVSQIDMENETFGVEIYPPI